jgi:hypothetical protein
MTTPEEIAELCRAALEKESGWREGGTEERRAAFESFQRLLHAIAELTGRSYEDVMNDAVEEWVTVHFCEVPTGTTPSAEWQRAAQPAR